MRDEGLMTVVADDGSTPGTTPSSTRLAGLLLTGGASRRMGFAKGRLEVGGVRLSRTLGALLAGVTDPCFEVGPGYSNLPTTVEGSPGNGPVSAIVAGWDACGATRRCRGVLVLACDLPFMTVDLLEWLATRPGDGSVVPVVADRPQPLCARWAAEDVEHMRRLIGQGERSFRPLYHSGSVTFLDEGSWGSVVDALPFADADTQDDLHRLGLSGSH